MFIEKKPIILIQRAIVSTVLLLLLWFTAVHTEQRLAVVNARLITMNADNPVAEAMLVINGTIGLIGTTDKITAALTPGTQVLDLDGKTVLPGFVDAHSHFPSSGLRTISIDLSPTPIGDVDTVETLLATVSEALKDSNKDDWLLGLNYDNTALAGGTHPTRAQLDVIAPDHPVFLWHNSGHMGVANSIGLAKLGIDDSLAAPFGGAFGRDAITGKLNGLLQEKAAPPLADIVSQYSLAKQFSVVTSARDEYLSAGVTTVQNGYAGKNVMLPLRWLQRFGVIPQRIIVWPAHEKKAVPATSSLTRNGNADFKFAVGAVKILVDGSPQGMTAFLSAPYFDTREYAKNYRGFALLNQQALTELATRYHVAGHQLALHGNGDAAIDLIIEAVANAQQTHPRPDARHIVVHAQVLRKDQVLRFAELSITPSFFTTHTYYWGDWHREHTLGPVRAANISPAQWAKQAGLRFSLHSDAPVTPINPFQLLWSAVNRRTSSDFLLGPEQRIDMHSALRALTIDAAWQNHLEGSIGSLESGKLADFIVLSENPYTVEDIRSVEVLSTYINGVNRFERQPVSQR